MVMSTCSLMLNGPGFSVNSNLVPAKKARVGRTLARRCPMGTTAIWAEMAEMDRGCVLYQKNWLANDKRTHDAMPKTHILNVITGNVGSSVLGTVTSTCGITHLGSSLFGSISIAGGFWWFFELQFLPFWWSLEGESGGKERRVVDWWRDSRFRLVIYKWE
ncbi:hypothetical protein LINGRAHAP2_LOCUS33163 [Linum grandiflorum]